MLLVQCSSETITITQLGDLFILLYCTAITSQPVQVVGMYNVHFFIQRTVFKILPDPPFKSGQGWIMELSEGGARLC